MFNRALLLQGSVLEIAWATGCIAVGLVALAVAIEGYLRAPLAAVPRLSFAAVAGMLLLFTDPQLAVIAAGMAAMALFIQRMALRAT